jgi:integrase
MEIGLNLSLRVPLRLPVRVRILHDLPKIIAGGIPVTPINLAFKQRQREAGATQVSLETYARAAHLYVEFCAHRGQTLLGVSNEEFHWFKQALLGHSFLSAAGTSVTLSGERKERTADLMIVLLYSLATDIAERYEVTFDWLRYKGVAGLHFDVDTLRSLQIAAHPQSLHLQRSHRIRYTPRKVLGLPDEQFVRLLVATRERWKETIADGDIAYADNPDAQRGALFWRNIALLMVLRCAGSRRSEVVQLRLEDLDRAKSLMYLATKRHKDRLPVLMYPWVRDVIWRYVTTFRPVIPSASIEDQQAIFLSHSVRNYGERISDESVRALVDSLRSVLDPPWNENLKPHMLRHSFGYDLQRLGGPAAVTTNMRHASLRSGEPYQAGPEQFEDEVLIPGNEKVEQLFAQAGLLEVLRR